MGSAIWLARVPRARSSAGTRARPGRTTGRPSGWCRRSWPSRCSSCSRCCSGRAGRKAPQPRRLAPRDSRGALSRVPGAARDGRLEGGQIFRRVLEGLPALGAHVCGHQQSNDFETILERKEWLFLPEENAGEMPILGFVPVGNRLFGHDGHLPDFSVLFLNQVLTFRPANCTTEEELETAVESVPAHRVLRPQQLG